MRRLLRLVAQVALAGNRGLGRLRSRGAGFQPVLELPDAIFLRAFQLEPVIIALNGANIEAAKHALIDHYRRRRYPPWPPFPTWSLDDVPLGGDEGIARANRLLDNRFLLAQEPEVHFAGGVDWRHEPTSDPRRRWSRELHRHRWLAILGTAYQRTGDERYAEKFVQLVADWIRCNRPPPSRDESHVAWTLMGVGMRCAMWSAAFGTFRSAPAFGCEEQLLVLRSICEHARFLFEFKTHSNHLLREINGLLNAAAYFQEFGESVHWKQRALERLATELSFQVNPDGSHIEQAMGYQWLAAEEIEASLDVLESAGWQLPRGDVREVLGRVYNYIVHCARPDGSWPQLGDGFTTEAAGLRDRLQRAGAKLNRNDLVYVAQLGAAGAPSAERSNLFPYAGLAVMRTGWNRTAHWLLIKAGGFGGVHGHEDKLSIELCVWGEPFIVDPGSYTYNTRDPYRAYFVSSHAHNTVVVDAMSQVRRWSKEHRSPKAAELQPVHWVSNDAIDYFEAEYSDGYGDYSFHRPARPRVNRAITHRRRVLFVKPRYWIIVDDLIGEGTHEYVRLFQTAPYIEIDTAQGRARLKSSQTGGILHLLTADPVAVTVSTRHGCEHPIGGWVAGTLRNHRQAAGQLRLVARSTGPTSLITLLYPAKEGGMPASLSLERIPASPETAIGVRIASGTAEDWVLLSKGRSRKRFGSITTSAAIAGFRLQEGHGIAVLFQWYEEGNRWAKN